MENRDTIYQIIEEYAEKKDFRHTKNALKLVRKLMQDAEPINHYDIGGISRYRGHYEHALSVCRLLINLNLPVNPEEEDIVLSAALCHIIPNKYELHTMEETLMKEYHMDPQVLEIILLIINDDDISKEAQTMFYDRIQKNKLALIVFLADRANVVQQLYSMSIWSAREYIFETRSYFLPMCIYAKENYPDLIHVVSLLMEKVRILVDACMILLTRYENRELELTDDILSYQEENARIREIIRKIKMEKSLKQ